MPLFDPAIFDPNIFDCGSAPSPASVPDEVATLVSDIHIAVDDFQWIKQFIMAKQEFAGTGDLNKYSVALQKLLAEVGEA